MTLSFTKMNGAGNDFVVIDNRALDKSLTREQIARLCDRHRGVGADGLLAVEPAEKGADVRFRYYNADGGEAEMCGNGARCFGRYTARLLGGDRDSLTFETIAGTLTAQLIGDEVCIDMSEPFGLEMNSPVEIESLGAPVHNLNTGVPHAVSFVSDLTSLDVVKNGAAIRDHSHYQPKGTNANFVGILAPDHLAVRTYERGVEGETLACGTGITACALIHHLLTGAASPIKIDVQGGDTLSIGFEPGENQEFTEVTLTGPADFVFDGEITA
ncbi:MAG: diaminopimelate epimerase [Akkermansiaceae bacterium]|jgi:diaminopimelate epimerase